MSGSCHTRVASITSIRFALIMIALGIGFCHAIRGEKEVQGIGQMLGDRIKQMNPFAANVESSPWVQQVGLHPRVFYLHNFLTDAERTHMIRLAAPKMRRSSVVGAHGEGVVDEIRTSHGMFISRLQDPIIERIERRISVFTQLPVSHQESIQVLRYVKGQKYGSHYDSAYDNKEEGPHHRVATFYMYLSDVEEGGETAFPQNSEWFDPAMKEAADPTFSDCAKGHVAAKPKAGDAVLFYSFFPNKTMDMASMHTGCPVIKGIKWGSPVWIHVDEYEPAEYRTAKLARAGQDATLKMDTPSEPGMCEDYEERCVMWAGMGECTKSPGYMVGDAGMCRKACKACEPCKAADDWECIHANRKAGGYLEVTKEEMEGLGVPWWME